MIVQCLVPEVQIWRLPNRKPLHWRHSVGVSPVQLRTHWAIELVVGTLHLEKGRKLQYSFHFRSLLPFCFYFLSILVLYNDVTIALNGDVTTAHVHGHENGHVSTDTDTFTDRAVSTDTNTGTGTETCPRQPTRTPTGHGHMSTNTNTETFHEHDHEHRYGDGHGSANRDADTDRTRFH